MSQRQRHNRVRVLVGVGAIASGLVLGGVVVALLGGDGEPGPYRPFFAGYERRIVEQVRGQGPVFYPDPQGGTKGFYLDLEDGEIVALHVVPPGGDADCPVGYEATASRYETCDGDPVERGALRRFPVTTRADGDEERVFVDLREPVPAPQPASGG